MASCPQLLSFKDDPIKTRRLIAILRGMHPTLQSQYSRPSGGSTPPTRSSSTGARPGMQRSATPTRSNVVRHIAQDDDTATDKEDSQITALNADDATIGDTNDEQDF